MTAIKNKEHLIIIRISQSLSPEKKGHVFEKKIKPRKLQGEAPSVLILQIRSRDSISGRGTKLCSRDHKYPWFESRQTHAVEAWGCFTAFQVKEERD